DGRLGALEMEVMGAGYALDLDVREQLRHLAVQRPVDERALLGEQQQHGCRDAARERARVLGRQSELRLRLEPLVGMPLKPARHLAQRAAREYFRGSRRDLGETACPLGDRRLAVGEDAAAFV